MTQENYEYRTSERMLRRQFEGSGIWRIPLIPKAEFEPGEFEDLRVIGFDRTKWDDTVHLGRMVHFFLYDYKFERVWNKPDHDLEKLKRYRAVFSPDFSMYLEMNPVMQLYNTFRNRWCGANFAAHGMRVIPTVSWGDENTFDFCFEGIEKGGTVAVSTYMVSAHDGRADQKDFFLKGYDEMLRRIEPERILCYNTPFPEMQGNIVFLDYDLSSWRHMDDDLPPLSKYAPYICGAKPVPEGSKLIIKRGHVLSLYEEKGMGSAFGGRIETSQKKNPTKGESEIWKNLNNVKGQDRKTSGVSSNKKYYEWDHTHNDIEVYDKRGHHLGSMDPTTGEMYKPAVPGRTIKIN